MKDLKNGLRKQLSLLVALVMVFGVVAPLVLPALQVYANRPPTTLPMTDVANDGTFRTTFNERLEPGFTGFGPPPAHSGPNFHTDANAPEGSISLNWPLTTAPGTDFMYALRFFDANGHRHELSVRQIDSLTGIGMMVNYDVFLPLADGSGYVHVNDPVRRAAGGGAPGDFGIIHPGGLVESAHDFFVINRHGDHPDQRDTYLGTNLGRVNDRPRFEFPPVAGADFSPVREDFFNLGPDRTNPNSGTQIPNPDYDPDADPSTPEHIYVPTFNTTPGFSDYYRWLTPSFNIAEGQGFSFRFWEFNIHFLWYGGQFFVHIEELLVGGNIHQFVLERYNGAANVNAYVIGTAAASPAGNQLVGNLNIPTATRRIVYAFVGFHRQHHSVNSIPIAASPETRTVGGAQVAVPNINVRTLAATTHNPWDAGIHWRILAPTTPADVASPAHPYPLFNTDPVDLTERPFPDAIPEPDIGMDMRFNLPTLFDESEGGFVVPISEYDALNTNMRLNINARVRAGVDTSECFSVDFPVNNIPAYNRNNAGLWGEVEYRRINPILNRPPEITCVITVQNVSMLTRMHHLGGTEYVPHDRADRVRVAVGGLRPSIAYERVLIYFTDEPTNFLIGSPAEPVTEGHIEPFYTFIEIRPSTVVSREVLTVTPFNESLGLRPPSNTWYGLTHDELPGGRTTEIRTEATREIHFELPTFLPTMSMYVSRSGNHLNLLPPFQYSQNVIWSPDRRPRIDIPDNFVLIWGDDFEERTGRPFHRPLREERDPPPDHFQAGYLQYRMQWNIATHRDVMSLLGHSVPPTSPSAIYYPGNQFGQPDDVINVTYVVGLSSAPDTMAWEQDGASPHRTYLRVNLQIRRNPASPMELEYRILSDSDFIAHPDMTPPILPRFMGGNGLPATPHPILNRCCEAECVAGACGSGWMPLNYRPDIRLGENAVFAELDIITNSVRRERYPPPPENLRRDIDFPAVHFMNVRLHEWSVTHADSSTTLHDAAHVWSLFDYMVVDDFGTLTPPPPSDLTVSAGPENEETQPYLNVSYNIPGSAILAYLRTFYPLDTQITTNLYIGQFQDAIMSTFFPGGGTLAATARRNAATINIPFSDLVSTPLVPVDGRIELDLLDHAEIQRVLRGQLSSTEPNSGVVRIYDIPLFHTTAVYIATPASINMPAGRIVNYEHGQLSQRESFDETYRILNEGDFGINLRLTGMEENAAFFIFSDLEVKKYVADDEERTSWTERDVLPNPAVSVFTGVVTDTTVGTPQAPGPGDVGPSAPQNLRVYEFDQMMAALRWDPYALSPSEVEDNIRIEWEILRIQDRERLTDEQMNGTRNEVFSQIFNERLNTAPGHRKGWITDRDRITVFRYDGSTEVFPTHAAVGNPDLLEDYEYSRMLLDTNGEPAVELRDRTLFPNNMYFYYVRTVRLEESWDDQLMAWVEVRSNSVWVEVPVTTYPIQAPVNLRQEDPLERDDFCGMTMVAVSWEHVMMSDILAGMGDLFVFQYQIRRSGESWGEVLTVPPARMTEAWLDSNRRVAGDENRIHYIADGLEHSTVYEMRVRLLDMTHAPGETERGDASLWSNTLVFMTEVDQEDDQMDREIDDWLNYLRRRLEEFLRRPFWLAHRTPYSTTVVIRPEDVFRGLMDETVGTDIRLHNPGTDRVVYYIPASALFTANENRYGFSTAWSDIEFLFAPSFLTDVDNQALIDMARAIDERGSDVSDAFVRLEFVRNEYDEINGRPAITPRTQLTASMAGTNDSIRNITTWDRHMLRRATAIVEDWLTDAVMRENIRVQLIEELSNEDMSDHLYDFIDRVLQEIINATSEYMVQAYGGILHNRRDVIYEFDAAMHVIATPPRDAYSVFGYEFVNEAWRQQNLIERHNGRAMIFRRPGIFAFTGREIIIPDIEITPRGGTVISIVARYGLEDLFGVYVDLEQFANRQMVIGSIARTAGVPANANAMNWATENLDVQLTSRNATGLISRQEAIAVTVALYAHRTNQPINTLRINNHANTAGMNLDARFAPSVRAAFELGLVSDTDMDPAGPITIGEFLDMLTLLNARVRV
ncbi:MAG: hypothetical protein FWF77_06940 [Defluviitaleaceae bacterium]|nr:hypothetical protein [Defluviitaleaceae bacterium]